MSLCYDFQKWMIVSLASVAISLTVGLVLTNFAYGQYSPDYQPTPQQFAEQCTTYNTEILKIVSIGDPCTNLGDAVSYWLSMGYKIASVGDGYVFMTKG